MSRPLRIDVENGWYHITSRGIERRTIFCDDRHCGHFLELLEEMVERHSVVLHAYVLMGNHYHLILQTPNANASAAMQWLNVSYSAWFNAKNHRAGHLFQGRFKSRPIDGDGSWALDASVYVHLNPVRVSGLGLDKQSHRAESAGSLEPSREDIAKRLNVLEKYRWSSYPGYAGYAARLAWLTTVSILRRAGGREKYRRYVEFHVTRGRDPDGFRDLKSRFLIGGVRFAERMKALASGATKEQPERHVFRKRVSLDGVVHVVERVKGEKWEDFRRRRGDWGRPCVLYLARQRSGCTLREIGDWLGGVDYKTVSKTVERFGEKLKRDKKLRGVVRECLDQMSNVECRDVTPLPTWSCGC